MMHGYEVTFKIDVISESYAQAARIALEDLRNTTLDKHGPWTAQVRKVTNGRLGTTEIVEIEP
jgi:hypothetical protein